MGETGQDDGLESLLPVLKTLPTLTLTLYVPSSAVGAIIGRRGQNIAQIQKNAASAAVVSKSLPVRIAVVGTEPTTVPATYTPLDSDTTTLTPIVTHADPGSVLEVGDKLMTTAGEDVILDIPLPSSKHASVVGKRGLVLQTLSADHHVRIMVPNKDLRHDVVQLEGQWMNVKSCWRAMMRVLHKGASAVSNEPQISKTIAVPSPCPNLRFIIRKTGASIEKRNGEDQASLVIAGSKAAVQEAIELVENPDSSPKKNRRRKNDRSRKSAATNTTMKPAEGASS